MPFYDYKCGQCGKTFEVRHGMTAKPQGIKCEFCGFTDVQRIFQPVGMMRSSKNFSDIPASSGKSCSGCASGACGSCR